MRQRYHITTGSVTGGLGRTLKTFWGAWDCDKESFVKNAYGDPVMYNDADGAHSFCQYLNGLNPETEHHSKDRDGWDYYRQDIE